jgi:hypothetical protein
MNEFTCPDCRKRTSFPNSAAGQVTKCPGCNGYIKLPPLDCELPVARAMCREFYARYVMLALMVLGWVVLGGLLLSPPTVPAVLLLFALALTLGTVFMTVWLPWYRRTLPARFLQLGRLTGKTVREIVVVAGDAHAYTDWDDETELLEWRANNYYVALVFRDEICQGVQQEARVDVRQAL